MSNTRDLVWIELMHYDRKVWTVQDMVERTNREVSENTVRRVFQSAVDADLMSHKEHTHTYYLN